MIPDIRSYDNVKGWIEFVNKVVPKANIFIGANKLDLVNDRKLSPTQCAELSKLTGFKVFEISAKTGENINNLFFESVTTLSAFEGYSGDHLQLLKQLEEENNLTDKQSSYFSNTNKDAINLETGKAKITDSNSFSKDATSINIKIKGSNKEQQDCHEFPKKECKC